MYEHTHPITIISNLSRVLYLLIIPVLRGFLPALRGDLLAWVRGAWVDILVFLVMIGVAVLRWYLVDYSCDDDTLILRTGLFTRRVSVLRWEKLTTVSIQESFYLRPFRAVYFRADTMGGSYKNADATLFLRREKAYALMAHYKQEDSESIRRQYVPNFRSILSLSLLTSNSLGGIVFIATFISQAGRLLGREFSDLVLDTFEDLTRTLAFGIPPAAAAIAYALLIGWLIGFLVTFASYNNFVVGKRASTLHMRGGTLTLREYTVSFDDINFIDIRQSLATKLLRLYSLYISAVGYGKRRGDITCVIPTEPRTLFLQTRRLLFPGFALSERTICPSRMGFMRYLFQPLCPCLLIPAAGAFLITVFPSWSGFILFTGLMLMAPSVYFLIVRIIDFCTGGISRKNNCYTIRYSSGFYLHTVIIPAEKIVQVRLRQSPMQAFGKSKNCDVYIYTVAEGKSRHLCRNVSREQAAALFGLAASC